MKLSEFRSNPPPRGHVYTFVCDDAYLIEESQPIWAGHWGGEWDFRKLSSKEFGDIPSEELMEWALTPPLFGPARALMVENAGKVSQKRTADIESIAGLKHSSLKIVLLLTTRGTRRRGAFPTVEIEALRAGDTIRWLSSRFGLSLEVSRYLVDNIGTELLALKQEAEKLQTYVGGTREVGIVDVEHLVFRSERYGPFDLDDAFLAGDYPKSVRVLNAMLEEGVQPILILSRLVRVWRQILIAQAMGTRRSPSEIARAANVPHWKAPKFVAASRRFDRAQVVEGFSQLVAADRDFKTRSPDSRSYLHLLLWKLIA